jgi:hypothetical protein
MVGYAASNPTEVESSGAPKMKRLVVLFAAFSVLLGCTSDEEKITRVIEKELKSCQESEETFYEVTLFDDSKVEMLSVACDEPIGEIERIDDFKARTTTGPYTWLFGIDEETGVWVLSGVSWDTFEKGKRDVVGEDLTPDVLQSGIDLLGEARKEWDKSAWILEHRLDAALRIRRKTRGKAEDTTSLGEQPSTMLDDAVAWAKENEQPELAARSQLMVVDYFKNQRDKLVSSLDNFGGQDEWLENLIAQAKKDKNKEDEKKYTDELAKIRAERPGQIKEVRRKIFVVTGHLCDHIGKVDSGVGGELGDKLASAKNQVDCSPEGMKALEDEIEAPIEAAQ